MDEKQLFEFYEKSYFHEIEMRERLNSRPQIYLALIGIQSGFIAFVMNSVNYFNYSYSNIILFIVPSLLSLLSIVIAIGWFIFAWHGHEYKFLPTARMTEDYKIQCQDFYKDYSNKDDLTNDAMRKYIYDQYISNSTINTKTVTTQVFLAHNRL